MEIQLLAVPYDSGNRGVRMGAGPEALIAAGLPQALRDAGHSVHVKMAELPPDSWSAEIQTGFELMRMLAGAVREARDANRLPVVLAGNCNTAIGTLAGLGTDSTGVVWFDAHADFNTPETTTSGFLDGTAVAILTGRCWTQLAATVPGFQPVADERVCLVGTRDIDSLEGGLLEESSVQVVSPRQLRSTLRQTLSSINEHVEGAYVHLDLDVLDSGVAAANKFAVSGGLTLDDMDYALSQIAQTLRITGLALTAYDPAADLDGAAAAAAIRLVCAAATLAGQS
ncbi:MAG TPA: arginase family protein [Gemmatimonadaceae bacterium]|jgi:arginase|nr:arginase family protein [Gemmatimonadaceae bacterium]